MLHGFGDRSEGDTGYRQEIGLGLVGVTLLLNPLYLGRFSVYPLVGWGDMPLFVAGFSVLGMVCLLVPIASAVERVDPPRVTFTLGLLAVPAFVLYDAVLSLVWSPAAGAIGGFLHTQLLVGSLVVAAFVCGALRRNGPRWWLGAPIAVVLPYVVLYVSLWQFDPVLEPAVDLLIFFTDDRVLGLPYLGTGLVLVAGLLGVYTDALD